MPAEFLASSESLTKDLDVNSSVLDVVGCGGDEMKQYQAV